MSETKNSQDVKLGDIQRACSYYTFLLQRIDGLNKELAEVKEQARQLSEETIPGMMDEAGLSQIQLSTGEKISCAYDVQASIAKDNMGAALTWLDDNGYGDLIKTKVVVSYQREHRDEAMELANDLSGQGLDVAMNSSVHPMTLKAWVKERLKNGDDLPLDLFGVRQFQKTVIK